MKRLNSKPVDKRRFICPQCGENRIVAPLGHVVNQDKRSYKTVSGTDVELHLETCDTCSKRNYVTYFKPTMTDIRKIMAAIKEQKPIEDKSLEELL